VISRRRFITGFVTGLTPLVATASAQEYKAQQREKVARIGVLSGGSAESEKDLLAAFQQGMRELGYVGGSLVIEPRYAAGHRERLPAFAAELVQSRVDVVLLPATAIPEANEIGRAHV